MPAPQPEPLSPRAGFAHLILERLTAIKTRVWMLRQGLRGGEFDLAEAEAHLDEIEKQTDEVAMLAANLQEQSKPPP